MKQNDFYEVDGCTDFIPVKLIEEHKGINFLEVEVMGSGLRIFTPSIYSFPKINEPQKPVIPKFVAEWLEGNKRAGLHLQKALSILDDDEKVGDFAYDENDDLVSEKVDTFARAWLFGYEIEQEKRYTVEIPNPNSAGEKLVLFKQQGSGRLILDILNPNISKPKYLHLTEAEIKQDFDFLWQFAKEVE